MRVHLPETTPADLQLFAGEGEMRARCRALNWSSTPLGPIATWSHSLRTTVATLLASHHPMVLWWGPQLVQIYNDGYRPSLASGGRHPRALGMRAREFWTEIWDIIGPQIEAVMTQAASTWHVNQLIPIERNNRIEEVYWTYGYSPVLDDDGTIGGTLVVCQETTDAVLAARRLQTLHTLAALNPNRTMAATAKAAIRVFAAEQRDVSFAICFLRSTLLQDTETDPHSDTLSFPWTLAHSEHLPCNSDLLSPERWPLDQVIDSRQTQYLRIPATTTVLEDVSAWPEPPKFAAIVPLFHTSDNSSLGILVIGLSARLPWDDRYKNFVHLAAVDVATHLSVCRDHAERERLIRAYNLERARLEYIFHRAPAFLAVLRGPRHVYELVNDAYYQIVGHRKLLGMPLIDALPELRGQGFDILLDEVFRSGVPFIGRELAVDLQRTPGGPLEQRFVDAYYIPIVETDGTISGIVAHGMDVTDSVLARREAERLLAESELARADAEIAKAAAEDANRVKATFLATMSHELRTPLNAIGGYAELIELGIHGPVTANQIDALHRLRTSQRHLLGLINDLLNYTRVEAGAVRYDLSATSVNETVLACETLIAPQMRNKGLTFRCEPSESSLYVYADGEKLRQILLNVLTNATKFTEPGGLITIRAEARGDSIAIHIIDTGRGIAADQLETIFEPFVQVDSRFTRSEQGIGLGLAISRDLARGMKGDLTVQSSLGVGSTFTLTLPRA